MKLSDGIKHKLAMVAWIGFGISLIVHFSTYVIHTSSIYAGIFLLHIGIFIVFIPVVISLSRKQNNFGYIVKHIPTWATVLMIACFVYAGINWFAFIGLSEGGGPSITDGQYVLQNHGQIIRELTEVEYEQFKVYEVRGFSGHWMLFYLFPALIFTYLQSDIEPEKDV